MSIVRPSFFANVFEARLIAVVWIRLVFVLFGTRPDVITLTVQQTAASPVADDIKQTE